MFALEWCEFCWAARKLLAALSVPYRSIDLDSVPYQDGDRGGRIRRALIAKTGIPTIPQIFVGGILIGGASDIIRDAQSGALQKRLKETGVRFDTRVQVDFAAFLPKWLQQARPTA
jgi:cysteine synthase A